MTIRVAINHITTYSFDRLVRLSPHVVRLRPAPHCRTKIHSYSLKVEPEEHFVNWQQDAFGNYLARFVFPEKTKRFQVHVEVQADMTVINPFDFFLEEYAQNFPFAYPKQLKKDLTPYLRKEDCGAAFHSLLKKVPREESKLIDFMVMINTLVHKQVDYTVRLEPGVQSPDETLELGRGSCRDSAWLLVQLLRHLGLAARFASGYLIQLTSDEKCLDGPSGPEYDFTDLHAWCEVFMPGAGWVGLDPTSGLFAGEGHIPLACTPEPVSAAPIDGFTDECEVEFEYSNEVTRILEDPRVTKPYDDEAWTAIMALGNKIDSALQKHDIRLTMGGEPTFVSIDDMESAQWNTEALGKDKLSLSKTLLLKLRDHYAPKGLLHYGQGKWYPGEEVPRWALGLFWRTDGEPLWRNPDLLARIDDDYQTTPEQAKNFAQTLCGKIQVFSDCVHDAYEDAVHYFLQNQSLPDELEKLIKTDSKNLSWLKLKSVLDHGMDNPVGFALPLIWNPIYDRWESSIWKLKKGQLVLLPGDSPMGLRLPLNEIPGDFPTYYPEADLTEEKPPLDTVFDSDDSSMSQRREEVLSLSSLNPSAGVGSKSQARAEQRVYSETPIRSTMCFEVREGKLFIFMPPLDTLEPYIQLLSAIESTAAELEIPVILEGYTPPRDPRMNKLLVTPDPGVIEVNVHPAHSWSELVNTTTHLYEAAKESRLAAEKFMLDGRHTGTGGGNHITLGGPSVIDSPMLRRPDLLRSFITYWQHHPSLSYLFSGAFIGPTSQAPRIDEGRDEILYELEIAFQQMPDDLCEQPWLVDRLLRNLLIDITGNTHRAEFCIDKLYAPGSATGRLGLLEFRGFEMPPHARMSLVQALLIRALVVRFWKKPYTIYRRN